MRSSSRDVLVAAVIIFGVAVGALVALRLNGLDGGVLMQLAGPVVAALFVTGHVSQVTSEQNRSIHKIERQTNGVLDGRIKEGAKAALRELAEEERQGRL